MAIRVLIVDDSAFIRRAVRRMLADDRELEVVGEAGDGRAALRELAALDPDVITLDLRMPGLDGVEILEQVMASRPTPVVLLSSYAQADAALTVRALAAGAVDFIDKSRVSTMAVYELGAELISKVKAAAVSRRGRPGRETARWLAPPPSRAPALIVLGASTGGPAALEHVLARLATQRPAAIIVAQHMPAGFSLALTRRLAGTCELPVREAKAGEPLHTSVVLVAPGGHDITLVNHPEGGVCVDVVPGAGRGLPRIDLLLESAAAILGDSVCAVILTGMGRDGVEGARHVRAAGGTVIAEAASTCTVFGMPRAVVEAGLASCVAPLDAIPAVLHGLGAPLEVAS
jgi:two-component system, chemotaxis family, protein-glutamate methylesterase/glutaminase